MLVKMVISALLGAGLLMGTALKQGDTIYVSRAETPARTFVQDLHLLATEFCPDGPDAWLKARSEQPTGRNYLVYVPSWPVKDGELVYANRVYIFDDEQINLEEIANCQVDADDLNLRRAAPMEIWLDRSSAELYIARVEQSLPE